MKTVKEIAGKIIRSKVVSQTAAPVCNYANNYYGDQVCVLPVKTK